MNPAEFWSLTEAETMAKVRGYYFTEAYQTDGFRSLYTLIHNVNVKKGHQKTKEQLWPLITDIKQIHILSHDEIVARNKRIRDIAAQPEIKIT